MRRTVLFSVICLYAICIHAQNNQFSFDQAFKSSPTNINKNLPYIKGWADDEHYIQSQTDPKDGKSKWMLIDVKSGKALPYMKEGKPLSPVFASTHGLDSIKNFTVSPDTKWAAYTKNHDLYAIELATNKIVRLTNDGSDVILNGYASWVYYEEILGRASRYAAFWWSPDSKQIAFM